MKGYIETQVRNHNTRQYGETLIAVKSIVFVTSDGENSTINFTDAGLASNESFASIVEKIKAAQAE